MSKKRSRGHPRNFETPEDLEKVWNEYLEDLKEQSKEWPQTQFVGRNGDEKKVHPRIPKTFEGFKSFCHREGYGTVEQYFTNQDDLYDKYIGICRAIKNEIRHDQIVGGMLGFFNPSITQRLNNLGDNIEVTGTSQVIFDGSPLPEED